MLYEQWITLKWTVIRRRGLKQGVTKLKSADGQLTQWCSNQWHSISLWITGINV